MHTSELELCQVAVMTRLMTIDNDVQYKHTCTKLVRVGSQEVYQLDWLTDWLTLVIICWQKLEKNNNNVPFASLHHIHCQSPCIPCVFLQLLAVKKNIKFSTQNPSKCAILLSKKFLERVTVPPQTCPTLGREHPVQHPTPPHTPPSVPSVLDLAPKCNSSICLCFRMIQSEFCQEFWCKITRMMELHCSEKVWSHIWQRS